MESNPRFNYNKGNPMYGYCGIYTDVCECRASKNPMVNTPPLSYLVIRTIVKKLKHPAAPSHHHLSHASVFFSSHFIQCRDLLIVQSLLISIQFYIINPNYQSQLVLASQFHIHFFQLLLHYIFVTCCSSHLSQYHCHLLLPANPNLSSSQCRFKTLPPSLPLCMRVSIQQYTPRQSLLTRSISVSKDR